MHALLDALRRFHGNAEQLDAIAKFIGGGKIGRCNRRDAFDIDRALVDLGAESKTGQQRQLLRRVMAFDVKGRIGFGVAELLRLLETVGKG